jgi:GNAT superfamily N-acetyltransferase
MTLRSYRIDEPHLDDFLQFARDLYSGDPLYLEKEEQFPPSAHLWMLTAKDVVIARCATFTRFDIPDALMLGWYESIEGDAGVEMLREICDIAREQGYKRVIGPMNGSTWHQYRLAMPSGRTFLGDVYHKSWYHDQFGNAGFAPIATYHSSIAELGQPRDTRGQGSRDLDRDHFEQELRTIYDISIASFSGNLYYSPVEFVDFAAMYRRLRAVVDPRLVKFALGGQGQEIGFMFAIPDLMDKSRQTIVLKTIAVHPDHRGKGVMQTLADAVRSTALELGYSKAIYALYEATNRSGKLASGGEVIRTYHLYERAL